MGIFASGMGGIGPRGFISVLFIELYVIGCGGGTGSRNDTAIIDKL